MTTTTNAKFENTGFYSALAAPGRAAEIPESADAYGWLIGSWEMDVLDYNTDNAPRRSKGEVHFAWTLEGRAVQDVWILPRRDERTGDLSKTTNLYGITLRVWDPAIQAWRVTWINPVSGSHDHLIGRKIGKDVVQIGARPDGTSFRWIFTDIAADSFRWVGETLQPDGATWKLSGDCRARRIR
jgi:hypothetical protein